MRYAAHLIAGVLIYFAFSACNPATAGTKINMPAADSVAKKELIDALNAFLAQKDKPNNKNEFVLKEDLLEMSALLDEMKGVEKSVKPNDANFYKAYITSIVNLNSNNFLIQLSYLRVVDKAPVLRASFRLLAKKQDGHFYFYSPLKQNTLSWKTKKMANINFHFKDTLYSWDAKNYVQTVSAYDKRLKAPAGPIEFYYCDNFPEALQMLGVDYKSDHSGTLYNDLSADENLASLEVNGGYNERQRFDPHDLWHERLRRVMSADVINRPVDEGCAYLYGGSWGISWPDALAMFKKYAAEHPGADWLSLYVNNANYADGDKPMKIPYVINALIVRKIEREKGFAPVMELLGCGKREQGDENYFKALENVSGISKAGFNTAVKKLILE